MKLAWSGLATAELRELRHFSVRRWGRDVAATYLADMRDAAKALAADPRRAKALKGRFRILRVRSHYLIVAIDEAADVLTVARVLHSSMDVDRHLAD